MLSVFACCHEADGSIVNVAKDEALTFVWGEVGQIVQFAAHLVGVGGFDKRFLFCLTCKLIVLMRSTAWPLIKGGFSAKSDLFRA